MKKNIEIRPSACCETGVHVVCDIDFCRTINYIGYSPDEQKNKHEAILLH
jgi:hypothetical protein